MLCVELEPASRAGGAIVLDQQVKFFPHSTSLNGSESGGGQFPARFFVSSGPAINRSNQRGRQRKDRMDTFILQFKKVTPVCLIVCSLAWFALLPSLKAQCPSDCNGSSTALGNGALNPASTGINNTAVGTDALAAVTTGQFNVAVGAAALANNTAGFQNMAVGADALRDNIDGNFNMAIGFRALFLNVHGGRNTGVGAAALRANTASDNTAIGSTAMRENTTGSNNTAVGA